MASSEAASTAGAHSRFEQLRFAREVILTEAQALAALAERLGDEYCDALELLLGCRGSVLLCGMGKAGLIGKKIVATLASTGAPSHFVHPAEAIHGDLGRIGRDDVVLALSFSGATEEIVRLLPPLRELQTPIIAVTGNPRSPLAQAAVVTLDLGAIREACSLGLAPSTSTTAMLALGDALALGLSRMRGFEAEDFARFHPGGSLGRRLAKVDDVMRPLDQCRLARDSQTVREVFVGVSRVGRRTGAIMLVDGEGLLTGLLTDSDLARLIEERRDDAFDNPVGEVMTRDPLTVESNQTMRMAVALLAERKISELPVVDMARRPLGLIDITDVVALQPQPRDEATEAKIANAPRAVVTTATVPFRRPPAS